MIDGFRRSNGAGGAGSDPSRRVALVCTGGTILSSVDDGTARLDDQWVERLAAAIRHHADASVEIDVYQPFLLHSEDVQPAHWLELAALVANIADGVDGVVVLHGTDTAAYTSAALHYLLFGVDVPVVVTGAMVPAGLAGSDAIDNVRAAAAAALSTLAPGGYLAFCNAQGDGVVYAGTRVRKSNRLGPFESVGRLPAAAVVAGRVVPMAPVQRAGGPAAFRLELDDRVAVIDCHPGLRLADATRAAAGSGMRGVVFTLYPSGTASTKGESSAVAAVRAARQAGLVAVGVARDSSPGGVVYPSTLELAEAGLVMAEGLPVEAAVPKLMWALAQGDPGVAAALMGGTVRTDCD
jgi:L-asparaginase